MVSVLTDSNMKELSRLGNVISAGLSCDINGEGVPCHTDRLIALDAMKDYLRLHNYWVSATGNQIVENKGDV